MTREETKMIVGMLGAVYINEFGRLKDEQLSQMIDVWAMLFEDEDANKIATVTKVYLKSSTNAFMPTPAMLINQAYELFTPKGMSEQEAWNILSHAITHCDYYPKVTYNNLPLEIQALCSPQLLYDWGQMSPETLNSVVASNFMRSFKVKEKQRVDYDKLPSETKTLISDLSSNMKLGNKGENNE